LGGLLNDVRSKNLRDDYIGAKCRHGVSPKNVLRVVGVTQRLGVTLLLMRTA
jgi:hypothetical protein